MLNRLVADSRFSILDYGTCLSFVADDDVALAAYPTALNGSSTITMAAWVYINEKNGLQGVVGMRNGETDSSFYILDLGNGSFEVRFRNSAGNNFDIQPVSGIYARWFHMACVINGTNMYAYINGELKASKTDAAGTFGTNTTGFYVGKTPQGSGGFFNLTGKVDDVLLYNKALTQAEVRSLHLGRGYASNPLIHWNFNEGSGGTAIDQSGNGNNGTITGASFSDQVFCTTRSVSGTRTSI